MSSFKSYVLRTVIHSVPSILTVFAKFQLTFKKIRNCLNVLLLKKIVYICNSYLNYTYRVTLPITTSETTVDNLYCLFPYIHGARQL